MREQEAREELGAAGCGGREIAHLCGENSSDLRAGVWALCPSGRQFLGKVLLLPVLFRCIQLIVKVLPHVCVKQRDIAGIMVLSPGISFVLRSLFIYQSISICVGGAVCAIG